MRCVTVWKPLFGCVVTVQYLCKFLMVFGREFQFCIAFTENDWLQLQQVKSSLSAEVRRCSRSTEINFYSHSPAEIRMWSAASIWKFNRWQCLMRGGLLSIINTGHWFSLSFILSCCFNILNLAQCCWFLLKLLESQKSLHWFLEELGIWNSTLWLIIVPDLNPNPSSSSSSWSVRRAALGFGHINRSH